MRNVAFFVAGVIGALDAEGAAPSFARDVRPILAANCFNCHGPDAGSREARLALHDRAAALRGGKSGLPTIVPGDPEASELMARVTSSDDDEVMPPATAHKSRLSVSQVDTLRRWIAGGANYEAHWAFAAPRRPAVPKEGVDWAENPIDRFIAAEHARRGVTPAPRAGRAQLARRVGLDLIGLPLSPPELDAFRADAAPDAFARLVDRLLASPRYGVHMAMSWLDVARYADTNGFQMDAQRMNWPWRDWVVRAFNSNQPFDQFTIEQLAGDLLPEPTQDQLIATAFNRNHMLNAEGGAIPEENRTKNVFDRVETTSTAWLGLTVQCAQCHDHKFDPVTQKDYYSLFGLFNQLSEPGGVDKRFGKKSYSDDYDHLFMVESPYLALGSQQEFAALTTATQRRTSVQQKLDTSKPDYEREFIAWVDEMRNKPDLILERIPDDSTRRVVVSADLTDFRKGNTQKLLRVYWKAHPHWRAMLADIEAAQAAEDTIQARIPLVMIMRDDRPRITRVLQRGNYETPGEEVAPGLPAFLLPTPSSPKMDRLTLARWLVAPEHPLTARVIVNRLWQQVFGRGLVKTAEDFGLQGELPSHPELLDWLAVEFRESGWNVKALLRLIVTSATYQQAAVASPALLEQDPDNVHLTRGPRMRLDSRVLRDQALNLSGLLIEKMGGPPVMPYQPPGIWEEMSFGKNRYFQGKGEDLYRRSLYTFWRRTTAPASFFDVPSREVCSVKPSRTSTPLHALNTLNDPTYVEASRVWAARLGLGDDGARVGRAFFAATGRDADARELARLQRVLDSARRHYAVERGAAVKLLRVGDSPLNETMDAAEHAAWTNLCLLILNLDETLSK